MGKPNDYLPAVHYDFQRSHSESEMTDENYRHPRSELFERCFECDNGMFMANLELLDFESTGRIRDSKKLEGSTALMLSL